MNFGKIHGTVIGGENVHPLESGNIWNQFRSLLPAPRLADNRTNNQSPAAVK